MSNNPNFQIIEVDFDALLLDLNNPRIYAWEPKSQSEAITAMMEAKGDHTCNLARDIAENGLGTPPIIIMQAEDEGKYVVMDGNRRIAAMKMLANPRLAPEKYRKRISDIAQKLGFNPPEKITVNLSTNLQAVAREIMRLHTGEQGGIGQVSWSALEQELFAYSHGLKLKYDLATKFLLAAEKLGVIEIRDEKFMQEFPISTLDRLLTRERLESIGIDVSNPNEPVFLFYDENIVKFRMRKIIEDMRDKKVHVSSADANKDAISIRSTADQEKYLQDVLGEDYKGKIFIPAITVEGKASSKEAQNASPQTRQYKPAPRDPYDRNRLIPYRETAKYGIRIDKQAPDKLKALYRELTKLRLDETPMAAAILCRTFLELTVEHGIKKYNISCKKASTLANKMQVCAEHLFGKSSPEYKQIAPLWGQGHFLCVSTLNQVVHAPTFPASNRDVCMFWEQLLPFLRACLE